MTISIKVPATNDNVDIIYVFFNSFCFITCHPSTLKNTCLFWNEQKQRENLKEQLLFSCNHSQHTKDMIFF